MVQIGIESPLRPDVRALLDEGTAWSRARYHGASNHQVAVESLSADGVQLCVARDDDGFVLGAGAVVLHPGWAEIKRLFVTKAARGRGVGRALLSEVEAIARGAGAAVVRLETGIYSDAAIKLYGAAGFAPCGRFGAHEEDPLSVFHGEAAGRLVLPIAATSRAGARPAWPGCRRRQ